MSHTLTALDPAGVQERMVARMRAKAKADLFYFAKIVLGYRDLTKAVHGPLCMLLEDRTLRRRKVTLPRGFFKTTVMSIAYPMWLAINNPNIRVLIVQNTITNAEKRLNSIDSHFKSNHLFMALFPELLPDASCTWNHKQQTVRRSGVFDEATFTAAGIRTRLTSNHFDVINEDDTVTPDLDDMDDETVTPSPEDINQAIGWHRNAVPLLADPAKGEINVVGTRWAELDLLSWIDQNQAGRYRCYERAALETDGKMDPAGSAIFPERFSEETLAEIAEGMGTYLYNCNYLGNPMRSEDMVFQKQWLANYYLVPPEKLQVYITIDLAGDPGSIKTRKGDFNVIMVCGKDQLSGIVYVLEYWRKRGNPGEVLTQLFHMVTKYSPLKVAVESVGYQNTLQYWAREKMADADIWFKIEPLTQSYRSKHAKIVGLQPVMAAGKVRFRPEMSELRSELEAYPLGAYDDCAEALSMQKELWQLTRGKRAPRDTGDEPFTIESIMAEAEAKWKPVTGGVMDIFGETASLPNWN